MFSLLSERCTPSPAWQARLTLVSIAGTTVLSTFINGALTVALPSIGKDLPLAQDELQWPLSMFALTNGAFLLIAGGLADAFGRRLVFLTGTLWYFIVSLATGFMRSGPSFIAMCAALGLGAALLTPAGVGILGASLPDGKRKNRAFAVLGAGQPIGFILGLVLGGVLSAQWRVIFYIQTGVVALFAILAALTLPKDVAFSPATTPNSSTAHLAPHDPSTARLTPWQHFVRFDWLGAGLSTSGLVLLTFALADAEAAPQGWRTPYIPALLPVSLILIISFLLWERKLERAMIIAQAEGRSDTRPPLMPLSIWKAPKFGIIMSVIFLAWLSFNVLSYYCTLMFQEVQQETPLRTSLLFTPMVAVGLVVNVVAGVTVGSVSALYIIVAGTLLGAASCLTFSVINPANGYGTGMLWVMLLIVGTDLFFPAGNIFACRTVGPQHQSLAGSLFNTTTKLATSLGLAITSTISTSVTRKYANSHGMDEMEPRTLLEGYRAAGWTCFACSIAAMLISLIWLRNIGIVGGKEPSSSSTSSPSSSEPVSVSMPKEEKKKQRTGSALEAGLGGERERERDVERATVTATAAAMTAATAGGGTTAEPLAEVIALQRMDSDRRSVTHGVVCADTDPELGQWRGQGEGGK